VSAATHEKHMQRYSALQVIQAVFAVLGGLQGKAIKK